MAVLCQNDLGAVLDHHKFLVNNLKADKVPGQSDTVQVLQEFNPDLFDIEAPFMMDTAFEKLKSKAFKDEAVGEVCQHGSSSKPRKRKSCKLNSGVLEAREFHDQVRGVLEVALTQLMVLARNSGHLLPRSALPLHNNQSARTVAIKPGPGTDLVDASSRSAQHPAGECAVKGFNKIIHNEGDVHVEKLLGHSFIIPAASRYLMSDASYLSPLTQGSGYDVIILDPPWYNKSVKRKRKYSMMYDEELVVLPIPQLARPGCLVAVWATNNQQQHSFIQSELFPRWHLTPLAMWLWLKVTKNGEPVLDINSAHRKPYETLFIGRYHGKSDVLRAVETPIHRQTDISSDDQSQASSRHDNLADPPDRFVLLSVPSCLHSHKPPLLDVLRPYIPPGAECLEMFARSLTSHCTSWGNEVLRLQHTDYFITRTIPPHHTDSCTNHV